MQFANKDQGSKIKTSNPNVQPPHNATVDGFKTLSLDNFCGFTNPPHNSCPTKLRVAKPLVPQQKPSVHVSEPVSKKSENSFSGLGALRLLPIPRNSGNNALQHWQRLYHQEMLKASQSKLTAITSSTDSLPEALIGSSADIDPTPLPPPRPRVAPLPRIASQNGFKRGKKNLITAEAATKLLRRLEDEEVALDEQQEAILDAFILDCQAHVKQPHTPVIHNKTSGFLISLCQAHR